MVNLSGSEPGFNGFKPVPELIRKPSMEAYLEPVRRCITVLAECEKLWTATETRTVSQYVESRQHTEDAAGNETE